MSDEKLTATLYRWEQYFEAVGTVRSFVVIPAEILDDLHGHVICFGVAPGKVFADSYTFHGADFTALTDDHELIVLVQELGVLDTSDSPVDLWLHAMAERQPVERTDEQVYILERYNKWSIAHYSAIDVCSGRDRKKSR